MVNVPRSEFELQSLYYVHFRTNTLEKGKGSLDPQAMDLIVSLVFFYKDGFFGIK